MKHFINTRLQDEIEEKRERLEARSIKAAQEATARYKRSNEAVERIPFGQPILVGHHSEGGHRRLLERCRADATKSFELQKKAEHLQSRSETLGTGGISSVDEDAIELLKEKLEKQQEFHAKAKQMRKEGQDVPAYVLRNSSARMRSVKKRIETIEKLREMKPLEHTHEKFEVVTEEGRIMIEFSEGKPSDEVRTIVKSRGFKWSPSRGAWVRKTTPNAMRSGQWVIDELTEAYSK